MAKKPFTIRVSEENKQKVKDYVRQIEGITKASQADPERVFKSRKDFRDIVLYCYYNKITLADIKDAFSKIRTFEAYAKLLNDCTAKINTENTSH